MASTFHAPVCDAVACFACNGTQCTILDRKKFKTERCPFFKTREQLEQEREYCRKRIAELRGNKEE